MPGNSHTIWVPCRGVRVEGKRMFRERQGEGRIPQNKKPRCFCGDTAKVALEASADREGHVRRIPSIWLTMKLLSRFSLCSFPPSSCLPSHAASASGDGRNVSVVPSQSTTMRECSLRSPAKSLCPSVVSSSRCRSRLSGHDTSDVLFLEQTTSLGYWLVRRNGYDRTCTKLLERHTIPPLHQNGCPALAISFVVLCPGQRRRCVLFARLTRQIPRFLICAKSAWLYLISAPPGNSRSLQFTRRHA